MKRTNMIVVVDSATVAYMNSAENFAGVSHTADDDIEVYFHSVSSADAYDKILLSCADEKHVEAIKGIAGAIGGSMTKAFTVLADDVNGIYADENITAVESITLAAKGNFNNVQSVTDALALTKADSGKVLMLDDAAGFTLTLPSVAEAGAGWNVRVIVSTNCTSNSYIITEKTSADTDVLVSQINELTDTVGPSSTGHTTLTIGNATDTVGDSYDIVCNGTKFFITGSTAADGGAALA